MPFESNGSAVSFPIQCNQMAVAKIGGEEVALGLTDRFRFYVNEQQVGIVRGQNLWCKCVID